MKNIRNTSIILNIAVIIFEIIGIIVYVLNNSCFDLVYYTHDSNVITLISSIIFLFYIINNKDIPKWLSILRYTATLSLTITFFVVIFALAPMEGFNYKFYMLDGSMLYFHTICPILTFISFIFYEKHNVSGLKDNFRGLYFTIIYSIILLILNIINVVEGPYPFLMVRKNPFYSTLMWLIFLNIGAVALSIIVEKLNSSFQKKY